MVTGIYIVSNENVSKLLNNTKSSKIAIRLHENYCTNNILLMWQSYSALNPTAQKHYTKKTSDPFSNIQWKNVFHSAQNYKYCIQQNQILKHTVTTISHCQIRS